jgi:hypothetical protein
MATYIGSTLRTGTDALSDTVDGGFVVVSQSVTVTSLSSGNAAVGSVTLPAGSQIIEMYADKIVNWVVGGGSATALNVSVGSTSGGAQYMDATDVASVARTAGTLTVADVAAMADIGTNTVVYCTVDPNGTVSTTQAQIKFTIVYAQKAA